MTDDRSKPVERKIMFFFLRPLPNSDGSFPQINCVDLFSRIQRLRFERESTGRTSRYCDSEGSLLCSWPSLAGGKIRMELGRVRRSDLPAIDNGGDVKPLAIEDDEGLLEVTHMSFFDDGIVGAEFNFYGPRATALATYAQIKAPGFPAFKLQPLLRHDVQQQLRELKDIRLFEMKVYKSEAQIMDAIETGLPNAFSAIAQEYDAETFDVVLRPKRGKTLSSSMRDALMKLIGRTESVQTQFQTLKVRGESLISNRVVTMNLLHDQFIQVAQVPKMIGKTRAINSESMYTAIETAYNALKSDLETAASVDFESWRSLNL